MNQIEIQRLRRSVSLSLSQLKAKSQTLSEIEMSLHELRQKASTMSTESNLFSGDNKRLAPLMDIMVRNDKYLHRRTLILRDVDMLAAKTAGYLSVLIEECMKGDGISLRFFIKTAIEDIYDAYQIKVKENLYLSLPMSSGAVGILTPYLIKTRTEAEHPALLAGIRNAIRGITGKGQEYK